MEDMEALALAAAAKKRRGEGGDVPANNGAEFFMNPNTGQMTSRELLANNMNPSAAKSAQVGAMQGLAFSGADEAIGGANAIIPGPGTMSERYTYGREYTRAMDERAKQEHPVARYGAEVAGGAATGLAAGYGSLPRSASLGQKTIAGGMIGSGEGATYGFLSGEGAQDRGLEAARGAVVGGTAGAAVPPVMAGLRAAGGAVANPIAGALNVGNNSRANSAVVRALKNSDRSMDDIIDYLDSAKRDGQGVAVMADAMGDSGGAALSGVASQPGPGRTMARNLLNQRQIDQSDRVAGFIREGFGADDTAKATRAGIETARNQAADVAYDAARSQASPVDVRPVLAAIDDRIGGMQGGNVTGDGVDSALAKVRTRLAADPAPNGEIARELSDFDRVLGVKQDVQDMIGVAQRQGRNNEARELTRIVKQLDAALEDASGAYRSANDDFARASQTAEAVDAGRGMDRPSVRAEDVAAQYSAMTPEQQAASRVGYADSLLGRVENSAQGVNTVRPLQSTRQQANMSLMADDPAKLTRQIQREADMFDTRYAAVGGSPTADKLASQAAINSEDVSVIANLLSGRVGAAGGQIAGRAANAMKGANEGTRTEIARLLLSRDPNAVSQALLMADTKEGRRRVIESMLRGAGRTGGAIALPN